MSPIQTNLSSRPCLNTNLGTAGPCDREATQCWQLRPVAPFRSGPSSTDLRPQNAAPREELWEVEGTHGDPLLPRLAQSALPFRDVVSTPSSSMG